MSEQHIGRASNRSIHAPDPQITQAEESDDRRQHARDLVQEAHYSHASKGTR